MSEMTLENFEEYVPDKILERGLDYFESGAVLEVEEPAPGRYVATVEGLVEYIVRIRLIEGVIDNYDCDCPYDWGPICKHIVALAYTLRVEFADEVRAGRVGSQNTDSSSESIRTLPGRSAVEETIDEILQAVSEADLREFVKSRILVDKELQREFRSKFGGDFRG